MSETEPTPAPVTPPRDTPDGHAIAHRSASRWVLHWTVVSSMLSLFVLVCEKLAEILFAGVRPWLQNADHAFLAALGHLQPFSVAGIYYHSVGDAVRDGAGWMALLVAFPMTGQVLLSQGALQTTLGCLVLLAGVMVVWDEQWSYITKLALVPALGSALVLPLWLIAYGFALVLGHIVGAPGVAVGTGMLGGAAALVGRGVGTGVEHEIGARLDHWVTRRLRL